MVSGCGRHLKELVIDTRTFGWLAAMNALVQPLANPAGSSVCCWDCWSTMFPASCGCRQSVMCCCLCMILNTNVLHVVHSAAAARHAALLQLQRRAEDLQDAFQRQRTEFLHSSAASLAASSESTAAAAEAAAARLSTAVGRQLLHDQLEGIQLLKQEQQEQAGVQHAAEAAVAAARAAAEHAAREERCAEQRAQVAAFKQQVGGLEQLRNSCRAVHCAAGS